MRLIDRLRDARTSKTYGYPKEAKHMIKAYLDAVCNPALPVIDVSDVATYMMANIAMTDIGQSIQSLKEMMTCALPPFSTCWMEFRFDSQPWACFGEWGALIHAYDMRSCSNIKKVETATTIGAWSAESDAATIAQASWMIRAIFSTSIDGDIGCCHSAAYFLLAIRILGLLTVSRIQLQIRIPWLLALNFNQTIQR